MAKNIDGPPNQHNETITKKNPKEFFDAKIWNAIGNNYEIIQGKYQIPLILLMVLNEATQPLSTTKISELISKRSKGQIYKISAKVRDSLQYRLRREGYVEGVEVKDKSLCSITSKEAT